LSISMEEALGLKQAKKPVEAEVEEEYSEADLNRIIRRKMVYDRRVRGDDDEEILHFLAQKGYSICRRTLHYDLKSQEVMTFTDELMRLQLRDIALLRGLALQNKDNPDLKALSDVIKARAMMIKAMQPKMESNVNVAVKVDNKIDISKEVGEIIKFSREEDAGK
jgi:hypothetical protein